MKRILTKIFLAFLISIAPLVITLAIPYTAWRQRKPAPAGRRWPTLSERIAIAVRELADGLDDTSRVTVRFS